jgi:type I thyroxine 5'-deiodinase
MYRKYRNQAAFYVVYIGEAHPTDLWQMPSNVRDNVLFASPRSDDERHGVANACVRKLGIEMPALVDTISDGVERAYTAWPDRLYVIDRDGRVAYKSAPGPFGFKPAEPETALRRVVSD